jgi:hypothetical protein
MQCLHDGIGDPLARFVDALEQAGGDPQARSGRGITQIAEHRLKGPQGLARLLETDLAEQAMLNRVPLRAAGWIVAHGHAQAQAVAELALELCFPQAEPTSITAPSVRHDQELRGLWVNPPPAVLPPGDDGQTASQHPYS